MHTGTGCRRLLRCKLHRQKQGHRRSSTCQTQRLRSGQPIQGPRQLRPPQQRQTPAGPMSSWLPPMSHRSRGSIQPGLQLARQSCRQSRRNLGNRLCRCWVRRQAHFNFEINFKFEFEVYRLVETQLPTLSLLDRSVVLCSAVRWELCVAGCSAVLQQALCTPCRP